MPAPERSFDVFLNDRKVGALHAHDDFTWFVLDPEYTADPMRPVLGLRFEEAPDARHSANMRLPPWFSNLLPEGRLREWIADDRGVSADREMELLAHVGHDLPGAVRVVEAGGPTRSVRRRREVRATAPGGLTAAGRSWKFSLAGVGLKFSLAMKGERFTAPAVGEGGDWILKLPDPSYRRVPVNEFAMMTLASRAGIDVPEIRLVHRDLVEGIPAELWPRDEDQAFAIRRFDRTETRRRVHIEDLAQVRGKYPVDKYESSFETVAATIYRRRDLRSLIEFVRRLAFIVIIRNGDAHLKNWSLIYRDPRVPEISPAYDLVSTHFYDPRDGKPENLGMKLGGTKRFETITLASFDRLQKRLGVEGCSFAEEVERVAVGVIGDWPEVREIVAPIDAWLLGELDATVTSGAQSILRRGT